MKHTWSDPDASGFMICKHCGATRYTDLKGWHKTPAMLNGNRQPFCKGKSL
jgi:hypothetical protein